MTIDATNLFASLLSTQAPLLPVPLLTRVYLALGWALVLVAGAAWLLRRRARPAFTLWPRVALLLLALWALWPGPLSPTYWLGLAFRAPSLLTALLCALWLWRQFRSGMGQPAPDGAPWRLVFEVTGVVLGWLLLLDTLAIVPVQLYAWGFSPALLGVLALAACLPWLLHGSRQPAARISLCLVAVLALFVALRLPTGNLWDALLDPWLWGVLQVLLLRRAWRWLQQRAN